MARQTQAQSPSTPWAQPSEQILQRMGVALDRGLGAGEVQRRRKAHGPNRVQTKKRRSAWRILAEQFKSIIVVLLVAASAVSLIFGERMDAAAIAAVVLINGLIGFFTELRAVRSMEALAKLGRVRSRVRREGRILEIPAAHLVPGDIVVIEAGDVVSADIRLARSSKLQADESALTGESAPVSKQTRALDDETPLADRINMLFKGTVVTRGSGEGVVVATGMSTELGQISALVEAAEEAATPLEKRLNLLGRKLIWATLGVVTAVSVVGVLAGRDVFLMVKTGVALAVAAVPEGLPIVATMALAQGMWRMARRNALINRLSAVETLGATGVIFTDKTGTLTENRMTVSRLLLPSGAIDVGTELERGIFTRDGKPLELVDEPQLRKALEIGVLCNNAALGDGDSDTQGASGEPIEVALLAVAAKAGMRRAELSERLPEEREEAFDPETKMMATFHADGSGYRVAVKGAPEAVIECCSFIRTDGGRREMTADERKAWLQRNQEMAQEGLRVLALAAKTTQELHERPYEDLVFVGLTGMLDPPREGVAHALQSCRDAGVRVIMVTGDHAGTAASIAHAVGLVETKTPDVLEGRNLAAFDELSKAERERIRGSSIFARVSPKQKLDLIKIHQENRSIVAMTGDGVNDAPALKKADIGIAMGQRGTQVAREAADMVLKDDSFATIVVAIRQGRIIFGNIRKFVIYLLSCNISEIFIVGLAAASSSPLPLLPIQILFLNLVTDVFPALALGVGRGDETIMQRPPRPSEEPILTRANWLEVGGYGVVITAFVLGAFALALTWMELDRAGAVTISFLTLAFAQLFHVFNMRDRDEGVFRNDVTANRFVWAALALCSGLLLLALYLPPLAQILRLSAPASSGWILVGVMSLAPLVLVQGFHAARQAIHREDK